MSPPPRTEPGRRATRTLLHVDWTRCDGHGSCVELLPGLLRSDEWGYPLAVGDRVGRDVLVPPAELGHARRAVAACPLMALRLVQRP